MGTKVTSKPQKSVAPKVSSRKKNDDSETQIDLEPPSRIRRAAASKTKAWESLIPSSRDSPLSKHSASVLGGSPAPAKSSKNQAAEKEDASRPTSRTRSRATWEPGPDPLAAQDVAKTAIEVVSSEESGSRRTTRRGRSQKKDSPPVAVNKSSEGALIPPARAVSAKGGSVRQGRKGKTVSPNTGDCDEGAARSASRKGNQRKLKGKSEKLDVDAVSVDAKKITETTCSDAEDNVKKCKKGKGSTVKGRKEEEEPLTKVSDLKLSKSGTPPVEESIVKEVARTGKWQSFSNESLSLKNKRLSLEKEESPSAQNIS